VRVRVPLAALIAFLFCKNAFFLTESQETMPKHTHFLFLFLILAFASCSKSTVQSSLEQDSFIVTPSPLVVNGGKISATVKGVVPERYMKRNAVVTLTPQLKAADGAVMTGEPLTLQGENANGSNRVISYRLGGRFTLSPTFAYEPQFRNSTLQIVVSQTEGSSRQTQRSITVAQGVEDVEQFYRLLPENDATREGLQMIAAGDYVNAERLLRGTNTNAEILAYLLCGHYTLAKQVFDAIPTKDAHTAYLHAIYAVKQKNQFAAQSYLKEAIADDSSLQQYADDDVLFRNK